MGFRFRKSFTIIPGVKINFGKLALAGSAAEYRLTPKAAQGFGHQYQEQEFPFLKSWAGLPENAKTGRNL